ncbi:hypothetical protein Tco_0729876 [Tanacetum coccineum]|uniref:Transposase (Putative), gypsy type n=1 Tax=Tanacetum coccineum TaxID=301880 RepID=A0ABQ4YQM1_9ASTR
MRWFTGKDFPRDSPVDPVDGDMILETLLNDKSKDIQRSSLFYTSAGLMWNAIKRLSSACYMMMMSMVDSAETRCKDRFYTSMSVDASVAKDIYRPDWEITNDFIMDKGPMCRSFVDHLATPGQFACLCSLSHSEKLEVEMERLNKIVNEKPSGDVARLRLGFEEAKKEVLHLKKQVENLKVEANKVLGLVASYAQKETDITTLNAKFQDLLQEKEQVELHNVSLRGQVDGEMEVKAEFSRMLEDQQRRFDDRVVALDAWLDKMAKETDEEFALMLRDAKATKEFLIGKGFRNFLNKFKESDILGARFGACISAAIVDGMRQGLEAVFVHGKRGMDLNSIPTYDINATEVYADALKHGNEVAIHSHPTFDSTLSAGGVVDQFSIVSSVSYAGDAGTTAQDTTPENLVGTVKTEIILAETALDGNASETLSSGANSADPTFDNPSYPSLREIRNLETCSYGDNCGVTQPVH